MVFKVKWKNDFLDRREDIVFFEIKIKGLKIGVNVDKCVGRELIEFFFDRFFFFYEIEVRVIDRGG